MARHSIPDIIEQAEPRQGDLRTDARPVMWNVIRSLRPQQWTKNLIIFGGLLFGQRLFDLHSVFYATAAFAVFCALSGVVYLLNDVADRDADRRHPLKRHRPIASGDLSASVALAAAAVIGISAVSIAFVLRLEFGFFAAAYVGLLALYSGGKVSYYSAPLFIFGRLREYYVPQIATGAGRLAAYIGLEFAGGLNAWTAAGLSALNVTANGSWLHKKSRPFLEWPEKEDPATDRELFHYILPAAPAMIFAAFQSQITLFLISIFGGTVDIAQVAALGRIGQLFTVLMTFNMIVVEPYIARLNRKRLLSMYFKFLLLAAAACTPVVLAAFLWPQAFLWLLGSKYEILRGLLGWVVLASCLNYLAGLMWVMNRARKWIFWSGTILEVVLLLVLQTAYAICIGIRTTREAVFLTFAMSFCYLIAHGYVSIYGFIKGPRILQTTAG